MSERRILPAASGPSCCPVTHLKFVTRYSPVALHFGSQETRLLQLTGGPGGWNVSLSLKAQGNGTTRHSKAASSLASGLKSRVMGKDACMATTTERASLSVIPVERPQMNRLQSTLEEAAVKSLVDSEGISYRYLSLNEEQNTNQERNEFLLMCIGQSEMRRCTAAGEALGFRPVGLEISAFPAARALIQANNDLNDAWAFLHLSLDHAYFGIALDGEIHFLKTLERNGSLLLKTMYDGVDAGNQGTSVGMASSFLVESDSDDQGTELDVAQNQLHELQEMAEEQGTRLMSALRVEAANLAHEIRACLRHFHARNQGHSVTSLELTGFSAGLPGLHTLLEQSLKMPTEVARPFTKLGIGAPADVLLEQHMWCSNLGLALRGAA